MKKLFSLTLVILAVFSLLYFNGTALAGRATTVSMSAPTGSEDAVVFNHTLSYTGSDTYNLFKIQVFSDGLFTNLVAQRNVDSDSQTGPVDLSSIGGGQTAYWKLVRISNSAVIGSGSITVPF